VTDKIVTRAQLAAELGCARSRMTQLTAEGMPMRPDGKLNRLEVLQWLTRYHSGHGGGWSEQMRGKAGLEERARKLLGEVGEAGGSPSAGRAESPEFLRGARWMAQQICNAARKEWPAFVAGLSFEPVPGAGQTEARALTATVMIHLLEGWTEDYLDQAKLPPVNWTAFGKIAGKIARESEKLRAEWAA
jgi:hypothetical protein